jgi:hypothetical protein
MGEEDIVSGLRDHQMSIEGWKYRSWVATFHRWVRTFDLEFKLNLRGHYPVIRVNTLRNAYGTYRASRYMDPEGLKDIITFDPDCLDKYGLVEALDTLLHEMLHMWQRYHGKPSGSWLHNAEFRRRAEACGLKITSSGSSAGRTAIFDELLAKHGVAATPHPALRPSLWGSRRAAAKTKQRKWTCGCTPKPMIVRCARKLNATCDDCHQKFVEDVVTD